MRTLFVASTLFMLSSCPSQTNKSANAVQTAVPFQERTLGGGGGANQGSPILIADGSIVIKTKPHFRVLGPDHAAVRLGNYQPYMLGYGCDPSASATAGPCFPLAAGGSAASVCTSSPTKNCFVDVDPSFYPFDPTDDSTQVTWALQLCYNNCTAPGAVLSWTNKDTEPIDIKFTGNFKIPTMAGMVALQADTGAYPSLTLAKLTVSTGNPPTAVTSYQFQCGASQTCLTLSYECRRASCGK